MLTDKQKREIIELLEKQAKLERNQCCVCTKFVPDDEIIDVAVCKKCWKKVV